LTIPHHSGIVVHFAVDIGENLILRQNTTIGKIDGDMSDSRIRIGNNVNIGANCCIIGLSRKIGDNATIGAMSFINKDIPSNCTYITKKTGVVLHK
ncbi:serine acetyltransferase, partial [Salmonella enterica]|nr:serine acetyltransferase [Salmonella enterica]EDT7012765.1 serine acetyltransferase [Salmonella enterica subsp. enterica serovar Abaetetuba]EBK1207070.1 serine acetyltransferase [Salmonella enterica]ECC2731134.1 serine acetyltransferase [Salmonella enterica]EGL9741643.1 serine acetyltransferase [Salmonella enterica]